MTETIGATHINPADHAKKQCLGIPIYADSRVIDPATLRELPPGEVGEIVMHGPQVFLGYWNRPEDTAQVFIELDGKRFFRSGDLGRMDEDGYFFIVDRLKRMINASGYKVWPTEVESHMYQHPAVQEACIIGAKDAHRGETVKAVIVPRRRVARAHRSAGHHRVVPGTHGGLQGAAHDRVRRGAAEVGCRQNHVARAARARKCKIDFHGNTPMKALLSRQPGGPDTLTLEDVPDPKPGRGEVPCEFMRWA